MKVKPDNHPGIIAYIGLGSNLGDRKKNIGLAIRILGEKGDVKISGVSSFYRTQAIDESNKPLPDTPSFLNAVTEIETILPAGQLLKKLQTIEKKMGRVRIRGAKTIGPRQIDLDLLLYDHHILRTKELSLPHPLLHKRRFVLEPMNEIAPQAVHPVYHQTMRQLLKR